MSYQEKIIFLVKEFISEEVPSEYHCGNTQLKVSRVN
jgi:hypothetical protein